MSFYKNIGDKGIKEGTLNLDPVHPKLFYKEEWIDVPEGWVDRNTGLMWLHLSDGIGTWVTIEDYIKYRASHMPLRKVGRGCGVYEE